MLRSVNICRRTFNNVRQLTEQQQRESSNDKISDKNKQLETKNNDTQTYEVQEKHPIKRTINILRNDMHRVANFFKPFVPIINSDKFKTNNAKKPSIFDGTDNTNAQYGPIDPNNIFPAFCDILVIGGGGVGSSIAYWLKKKARTGLNVVVLERDPTYSRASTVLSVGGLRQQFSLPENIQMSLYGADFIRDAKKHLGDDVDLNFTPHGYLILASEDGAETLKRNSHLQNELGARNEILSPERLKLKFPWLNTEGIALGCHGLEKEGWFDPWALLSGFKHKAREYGAQFLHGDFIGFEFTQRFDMIVEKVTAMGEAHQQLEKAIVLMPNGEKRTIKFAICVIAAGAASGEVARLANVGIGKDILSIPLPVEPRKRYVYVFNTQGTNAPGLGTPLTIDPDGTYFRRDGLGGNYICGRSPNYDCEPKCDNLDVDHGYFETDVWPTLAQRVKAFESAKVCGSWAGFYEYNMFDENGIIGGHPYYQNLMFATGFSGHGIQQTPAVGRAISELIMDGQFRTIDLSRLSFDRIVVDRPMYEANIV